ncbi:MAG TPA: hypothetical protein VD841_01090 [Arthrobacter sp.]|nr:hypothetical protein [Arthrobacter sp.]
MLAPDAVVDVRDLQHPYEYSRLLLAVSSTLIVFGSIVLWIFIVLPELVVPFLAPAVATVLALAVTIWIFVLVYHARLLGSAVLVGPDTLPRLAGIIEDVRTALDYRRKVDVYVSEKASNPVSAWNFLGTRIILLEGGLVADLQEDSKQPQLEFLLGSEFGRMKARHRQFPLMVAWLEGQENLKFLHLFLAPYFRATTYSGDQIGAACCGDFRAAAELLNRLLVGKDLSPSLAASGVVDQAMMVNSRWLPRFAQLAMNEPHLTNRYLNLMAFARVTSPTAAQAYFDTFEPRTRERLMQVIEESSQRRRAAGSSRTVPAMTAAAITVAALILAGITGVQSRALLLSSAADVAMEPEVPNPPAEDPEPVPATAAQVLLGHLPDSFDGRCQEEHGQEPAQARGLVVELACSPAPGDPAQIFFLQYESTQALEQVYAYMTQGTTLPGGTCLFSPSRGAFVQGAVTTGRFACYETDGGENVYLWTDLQLGIMGQAADSSMTFAELRSWQSLDAQLK